MIAKKTKKFLLVMMVVVFVTGSLVAYAARYTGQDTTGQIVVDYKLNKGIVPIVGDVDGYTNTTFALTEWQYQTGFKGSSSITISSNDGKKTVQKEVEASSGTNYARTGSVHLKGYKKNCTSSHYSHLKVSGKNYAFSKWLYI